MIKLLKNRLEINSKSSFFFFWTIHFFYFISSLSISIMINKKCVFHCWSKRFQCDVTWNHKNFQWSIDSMSFIFFSSFLWYFSCSWIWIDVDEFVVWWQFIFFQWNWNRKIEKINSWKTFSFRQFCFEYIWKHATIRCFVE